MTRTQVFFPEPVRAQLRDMAARTGLSASEIIRQAVIDRLRAEQPRAAASEVRHGS